jgi:hypothetical protein
MIQELLTECEAEAMKQGHEGEWQPTATDLVWVCAALGHKPTREEWAEAGLPLVGSMHVADDSGR